jgi:hypothetical protein
MTTPTWIYDILAGLMLAVCALTAARLTAARPWRGNWPAAAPDVSLFLMGAAMAGMLTPRLNTLSFTAWEVVFGALTAWFAVGVARETRVLGIRALNVGGSAPYLVNSAAMLYMYLAMAAAGPNGMSGMMMSVSGAPSGSAMTLHNPDLALLFTLILAGYSVWEIDKFPSLRGWLSGRRVPAPLAVPGAAHEAIPAMVGAEPAIAAFTGPGPVALPDRVVARVMELDQAMPGGGRSGIGDLVLSEPVTRGTLIAMAVTMAFMLIILI